MQRSRGYAKRKSKGGMDFFLYRSGENGYFLFAGRLVNENDVLGEIFEL